MPFYPDRETLYRVVRALFERVLADPEVLGQLGQRGLTLRITVENPSAVVLLDTRCRPPCYTLDGDPAAEADIGVRVEADTLHAIWLDRMGLREAHARGLVRLETNPLKALGHLMRLAEVFRYLESVYPAVLRAEGLVAEGAEL